MKRLFNLLLISISISTFAQGLPEGYTMELLTSDVDTPIDIRFIPDSESFVLAERDGRLFIFDRDDDGAYIKRPNPLKNISDKVTTYFERGVESIALDNTHIYIYYSVLENTLYGLPIEENGVTINRVSRFTYDPINNTSGEEEIILGNWSEGEMVDGQQKYITDGLLSLAGNHQGGGLEIIDGNLFISTGDGGSAGYANQAHQLGILGSDYVNWYGDYRSQLKKTTNGKILRLALNTLEGNLNNILYDAEDPKSIPSMTFARGFRNPWKISSIPGITTSILVNDVGSNKYEEISEIKNGDNGGWLKYEGFYENSANSSIQDPYDGSFVVDNISPLSKPLIDMQHGVPQTRIAFQNGESIDGAVDPYNAIEGGSLTGGVFIYGNEFGERYNGSYVFSDFNLGWINMAFKSNEFLLSKTENFAAGGTMSTTIDIVQAPDGSLFFSSYFGKIYRISYNSTLSIEKENPISKNIVYLQRFKRLEIMEPVEIYNTLGLKVLTLEKSSILNLNPGVYIAVEKDGQFKKFIIK